MLRREIEEESVPEWKAKYLNYKVRLLSYLEGILADYENDSLGNKRSKPVLGLLKRQIGRPEPSLLPDLVVSVVLLSLPKLIPSLPQPHSLYKTVASMANQQKQMLTPQLRLTTWKRQDGNRQKPSGLLTQFPGSLNMILKWQHQQRRSR